MAVIVWAYNMRYKNLTPYIPEVSNEIEKIHSATQRNSAKKSSLTVHVEKFDPQLNRHTLDLKKLEMLNTISGETMKVQRQICPPESAFAKGFMWEFQDDKKMWQPFDLQSAKLIEEAHSKPKQPIVDLNLNTLKTHYRIDVKNKTQTRIGTGTVRKINRRQMIECYLRDVTLSKALPFAPAITSKQWQQPPSQKKELKGDLARQTLPKQKTFVNTTSAMQGKPLTERMRDYMVYVRHRRPSERSECSSKDEDDYLTEEEERSRYRRDEESEERWRNGGDEEEEEGATASVRRSEGQHCNKEEEESCCICLQPLGEPSMYGDDDEAALAVVRLILCGHEFHHLCILEMCRSLNKDPFLVCPKCKQIYGEKTGTCPAGSMTWKHMPHSHLAGYEKNGTISVSYDIKGGLQSPEHPEPGQPFRAPGFPRMGYLPDTNQGKKVLKLLITAWRRRLTFTIGMSVTTGASSVVTWNEIHHKTELKGNRSGHGYPDPGYLDNVMEELAAHGILQEDTDL